MVGDGAMTAGPMGSGPAAGALPWHGGGGTHRRADLLASVRAGAIVLVLLAFLIALILL